MELTTCTISSPAAPVTPPTRALKKDSISLRKLFDPVPLEEDAAPVDCGGETAEERPDPREAKYDETCEGLGRLSCLPSRKTAAGVGAGVCAA
jgi:hypothetical protein